MKLFENTSRRSLWIAGTTLLLVSLGWAYYQYLTYYEPGVIPPLGKKIPFLKKTFKAEEGVTLHMTTGTHIVIPADALVDEDGRSVRGAVTASFREFHTPGEILHSGIPMQFGEDRKDYFSSGGMMELRVSQNGKELQVAKGSKINVDLASAINPDPDYKLYYLKDNLNWDNGKSFETVANARRDSALASLPEAGVKPIDPLPGEDEILFQITNGIKKTLARSFANTTWRLKEILSGEDEEFVFSVNWTNVRIDKPTDSKNFFTLHFKLNAVDYNGKIITRECDVTATPLLTGDELERAIASFEKDYAAYEMEVANIEREQTRLLQEEGLLNRFQLEEFGICNIDKLMSTGLLATVNITFDFEDELVPEIHRVMLYMVLEEQNGILKFNAFEWNKLPVSSSKFSLMAVLPDGKVAYVPSSDISSKLNGANKQKLFLKTERYDYDTFDKCLHKEESKPRSI